MNNSVTICATSSRAPNGNVSISPNGKHTLSEVISSNSTRIHHSSFAGCSHNTLSAGARRIHNYYSNVSISSVPITFDEIYYSIRLYFEVTEYKRSILSRWNGISLKSITDKTENEENRWKIACNCYSKTFAIYSMDLIPNCIPIIHPQKA